MGEAGKRPFWMHQLVEYILGGALVASGLQSPQPAVPAVLGGVIMAHAAITKGALAAFRVIDRKLHRVLDPGVIGLEVVGAVQPVIDVDSGSRVVLLAIAAIHFVVWIGSSFTEKVRVPRAQRAASASSSTGSTTRSTDRSTKMGQSAGRLVGTGVKAVRNAKAKRTGD